MEANSNLRQAVESLYDEAVSALQEMVRIDSTTGREQQAQCRMEQMLAGLGMKTDVWCPTDEELRTMKNYNVCGASNLGERPNVVGVAKGSGQGRSLILNGHIDTVPPLELSQWTHGPFSGDIEDGRLYGRGASDMKGGLLAAIFAYKAIQKAGIRLKGDLIIESVISEEDGGAGTLACQQRGYAADAAIIMEPTDNTVTTAETGTMLFRLIIEGKPAHGSAPYEGVSAIEKFAFILQKLNEWDMQRHSLSPDSSDNRFARYKMVAPISFGKAHAGTWCAMLPNELVAEGRYGFMLHETIDSARVVFEEKLAEIARQDEWLAVHPPRVEWFPTAWEAYDLSGEDPLVAAMRESCDALGMNSALGGIPYGTDIKFMLDAKIPTVLFGPGTIKKAHFYDEYVVIEEFKKAIGLLAETIVRWCRA